MTRLTDILLKARDTLVDHADERWSEARLIRLVDEGQKDIARHSKILRGEYQFNVSEGIYKYPLPDDVWLLTRATYDDNLISLVTYDSMDESARKEYINDSRYLPRDVQTFNDTGINWETTVGNEVEALVFDNRNMDEIRVFPIPDEGVADFTYTFENADTPVYVGDEVLGVVSGIDDYTLDSIYGVATDLYDPAIAQETFDTLFGVVTGMTESTVAVKLWYVKLPTTVVDINSNLDIPSFFDTAIRYYVIGSAFLDDNDAASQAKSQTFLTLYERELQLAKDTTAKDAVSNPAARTTTYRGAFE